MIVGHFHKDDRVPEGYAMIWRDGQAVGIYLCREFPPDEISKPGTTILLGPRTYERIAERAAATGTGTPADEWFAKHGDEDADLS